MFCRGVILVGQDGDEDISLHPMALFVIPGVKTSPGIGGNTRVENEGEGVKGGKRGGAKMAKNGKFSE